MKMKQIAVLFMSASLAVMLTSCEGEDGLDGMDGRDGIDGIDGRDGTDGEDGEDLTLTDLMPLESSVVPDDVFELKGAFAGSANLEMLLSSADILPSDSTFVYGSFMDGAALFPNNDGTYAFINNLESDYPLHVFV